MSSIKTKIVLVEDSIALREGLARMLSEIPDLIVSAEFAGAGDAIKGIGRVRPDIVILDIGLSSGSGLEVLHYLNEVHPRCKTIVFSNRVDNEYRNQATHLGATHVFNKISESANLFDAVAALVAHHSSTGESVLAASVPGQECLTAFTPNALLGEKPLVPVEGVRVELDRRAHPSSEVKNDLCRGATVGSLAMLLVILSSLIFGAGVSRASEEDAQLSVIKVIALRAGSTTFGSAVVIAPGKVITNCHVVRNSSEIKLVSLGRTWYGRVAAYDADQDLCVVTAPDLDIPSARIGSSQELASGDAVFAAGYPGGGHFTFSDGRVKGLYEVYGSRVIQTSAHFEPGASGGGLFDAEGRLLGILTFKAASGGDFHFVLPIEWVLKLIDEDTPARSPVVSGRAFWEKELREQPFFLQVSALEAKKDWHGLLKLAKNSVVKDVQRGEPWIAMSKAYTGLGRTLEADSALQRARDMEPGSGKMDRHASN